MLWFTFGLLTAFFSASEAAWLKRFFSDLKPLELAAFPMFYMPPFLITALLLIPTPHIQPGFWTVLALLLPLNTVAFIFHMRAINVAPISLTMPLQAFSPAFVVLSGYLFLGESISATGMLGIAAVMAGSYVLNLGGADRSPLAPLKAMLLQDGPASMLLAAVLYAQCAVMGKMLIQRSAPVFAGATFYCTFSLAFAGAMLLTRRVSLSLLLSRPRAGLVVGAIMSLHVLCHHLAISMVQAAYMMAVKRLNGLFSVLYGGVLFKEGNLRYRLTGAALMAAGTAVIALLG